MYDKLRDLEVPKISETAMRNLRHTLWKDWSLLAWCALGVRGLGKARDIKWKG